MSIIKPNFSLFLPTLVYSVFILSSIPGHEIIHKNVNKCKKVSALKPLKVLKTLKVLKALKMFKALRL